MKTFTLACLAFAMQLTWANEFTIEGSIDYDEEDQFEGDSVEELIAASNAQNINSRGWFKSDQYQSKPRLEKLNDIWNMLVPDATIVEMPREYYWTAFDNFFRQKANGSFCQQSDEISRRRLKTTHTQGIVAKVSWKSVQNPTGTTPDNCSFSGMYCTGSDTVIMRLSETRNLTSASTGLLPSMAFKFLVDGMKSENLFAMANFTGKDELDNASWDFFHREMSNRVERFPELSPDKPECERDTVEKKLIEGSNRPYATAVSFPAIRHNNGVLVGDSMKPDGTPESHAIPFQLNYKFQHNFPDNSDETWYDRMKLQFQSQSTIMQVWALESPLQGAREIHIADIVLDSDLYTSRSGDERLFFQHKRVQKDIRRWPRSWRAFADQGFHRETAQYVGIDNWDSMSSTNEEAEAKYIELSQESNGGCPFAWLLQ